MDVLFSILELLEPYLPVQVTFLLLICLVGVAAVLGMGKILPVLIKSWRSFLIVLGVALLLTIVLQRAGFFEQLTADLPEQPAVTAAESEKEPQRVRTVYVEVEKPVTYIVTAPPARSNASVDALAGRLCLVTAGAANVRSGPGEEYAVLGQVYRNERYTIVRTAVANTGRTWFQISVNGQLGWISSGVSDAQ